MDPVILIVDDNDDNRYTLATRLELYGYSRVETATDGRQALNRLRDEPVNLVLLDMLMPGLDGSAVLKEMKADTALREIPVIVVSAVDDASRAAQCIELGAVDYLTKPFNPILLKARVDSCVARWSFRIRSVEDLETRLIGRRHPPGLEKAGEIAAGPQLGDAKLDTFALFYARKRPISLKFSLGAPAKASSAAPTVGKRAPYLCSVKGGVSSKAHPALNKTLRLLTCGLGVPRPELRRPEAARWPGAARR